MQAMANAVENSEFVIMCMSDSYKRSAYCQAEAEYAFRCKRCLLPVIIRQGYRPDGWLGLLLASRIYIDFARLEFVKACQLLLKEIKLQRGDHHESGSISIEHYNDEDRNDSNQQLTSGNKEVLETKLIERINKSKLPEKYVTRNTIKSKYRLVPTEQWETNDVLDFLYDSNLHFMMPLCELMTGHGLIKLYHMCQTSPHRFYSQLNKEFSSRFNDMYLPIGLFTQFISEIERLTNLSSSTPLQAIENDALAAKSISSSEISTPPYSTVLENASKKLSAVSLVDSPIQISTSTSPTLIPQQIGSPTLTTLHRSHKIHVSKHASIQTESLVTSYTG